MSRTCAETAACVSPSSAAARVKLRWWATARKTRRWWIVSLPSASAITFPCPRNNNYSFFPQPVPADDSCTGDRKNGRNGIAGDRLRHRRRRRRALGAPRHRRRHRHRAAAALSAALLRARAAVDARRRRPDHLPGALRQPLRLLPLAVRERRPPAGRRDERRHLRRGARRRRGIEVVQPPVPPRPLPAAVAGCRRHDPAPAAEGGRGRVRARLVLDARRRRDRARHRPARRPRRAGGLVHPDPDGGGAAEGARCGSRWAATW